MFLRALIVLLLVVNLGVAAWWATRDAPPPPPGPSQPAGVPRLQLLREAPRRAPARAVADTSAAASMQCLRFGPYASPAALRRAHARLQGRVPMLRAREIASGTPEGWSVFMPPQPSVAAAEALVARMAAAGVEDLVVLREGAQANGVALGRYSSEASAQRRRDALATAGFQAQLAPIGVDATGWIDVGATASFDAARTAQEIGAATHAPIDCATLEAGDAATR
jgi:hypothetical protein